MISEEQISIEINRTIKSPIRIGNLEDLGINQKEFLDFYQPVFENLEDDLYLVRSKQLDFLKVTLKEAAEDVELFGKDFFEGSKTISVFDKWINQLSENDRKEFEALSFVTRKRNISSFNIQFEDNEIDIKRIVEENFEQDVEDSRAEVENELFFELLKSVYLLVKEIHPEIKQLKIASHFMRTISNTKFKGENSPEGIHEDGSDYIISALVINRINCSGAKTQIFEKDASGKQKTLYSRALDIGEFAFQADTGEEKTFGNDLWHYVTPIEPVDENHFGIRDIIGLDISMRF